MFKQLARLLFTKLKLRTQAANSLAACKRAKCAVGSSRRTVAKLAAALRNQASLALIGGVGLTDRSLFARSTAPIELERDKVRR